MPPKKRRTMNKPNLGSNALLPARNPGESTSIFPIAKSIVKMEMDTDSQQASSSFLTTDEIHEQIISTKTFREDADFDSVSNASGETVAVDFEETKKTQQHMTIKTEPPENGTENSQKFNSAASSDARNQDQPVHVKIKSEPVDNGECELNLTNHSNDKTQKKILEEKINVLKQNILANDKKIKSEPIEDNNNSQDATTVNISDENRNFSSAFSIELLRFSQLNIQYDQNDLISASDFLSKRYGHIPNQFQRFNEDVLSGDTALCNDTVPSEDPVQFPASVTALDPVIPVKTSEIASQQKISEKRNDILQNIQSSKCSSAVSVTQGQTPELHFNNPLSNGGQISAQSKNHGIPVTLHSARVQYPSSKVNQLSSTDSSFQHPHVQPPTSTSKVMLNTSVPKQDFPPSSSYLSNTLISQPFEKSNIPCVSNWTTEALQHILKATSVDPVVTALNSCDSLVDRNVTANTENTLKRNLSSVYQTNYFTGDMSWESVCSDVTQRDAKKLKVSSSHCLPVRDPRRGARRNIDPPVFSPRKGDRDLQLYLNVGRDIIDQIKFCKLILQWNPEWLHTQDETSFCPPIFDVETYTTRYSGAKYNYNDATEYYNTYVPLLLLNVWCKMFDNWKNRRGPSFSSTIELQEYEGEFYKYVSYFDFLNTDLAPKKDNIVLCQFRTGKLLFMRIANMSIRNAGGSNTKQKPNVKFELVSVEKVNLQTDEEVTFFVIYNCRIAVLQNKSLKKLNPSVEPVILKPSNYQNFITFMELPLPVDELAPQALKTLRDRISEVVEQHFVTLLDVLHGNPLDNPGSNCLKVIKYLAYKLYNDDALKYNVLICMENEDAFRDMVNQMRPYDPVLLVRTREVQLPEPFAEFILEKRLQKKQNVIDDIAGKCNIFITLLSAYKDEFFIRKKLKTACIIHNAHLCTETETVLPLIVKQLDKLLLFGNRAVVPNVPNDLKNFDFNLSLYGRFLKAKGKA